MGSSASTSDSEDDVSPDYKEDDDLSDAEAEMEKDGYQSLDLKGLFDHSSLRAAASKVRDELPENIIQQHHGHLLRWLDDRQERNEETVTIAQFCEVLMNRSVSKEDCIRAFQQFDSEGDGTADVVTMIEALRASSGANLQGELGYVVRTLQACSLTPGFIDVYNDEKQSIGQHGARILNFLRRNRAPSGSLPFSILEGFNNTATMRLSALTSYFDKLKDTATKQQEETMLTDGEELKPITKCYSCIEVSSNKADAYRVTNSDFSSYWQSDGSARSHWFRLWIKNNVVIKQLSIGVASSDQSYMPQLATVCVGRNSRTLREIKEVRIPSYTTGDVILLKNAKIHYPMIQINIKRCHSDGCDTRIHSVKTLGYRIVKESGISVTDASAVWYLEVLSSTAIACIPVAPQLRQTLINHTKSALCHMPPLSLCPASSERPTFLSSHVLQEMDRFLNNISTDAAGKMLRDGLKVELAFNLARGHVAGVIRTLRHLQEHRDVELDCGTLLRNMDSVRDNFWKKHGVPIQVTLCGSDGGQKDETSGPVNVLSSSWNSSQAYLTADGKLRVNMIFKGTEFVQLTKVRIKVDKGPRGPKRGMIFVYRDSKEFDLKRHTERFEGYDCWDIAEYNFCNKVRSTGIAGKPDNPVGFFTVEDEWDEVEVSLDVCPVGQYMLVKFLEPRQPCAERLGIVGIKFHGFTRKSVFVEDMDCEKLPSVTDKVEHVRSDLVIRKTLSFMVSLARDQVPFKKSSSVSNKPLSLDIGDVSVDIIWKLFSSFSDVQCQNLTLQLLHALFPFLGSLKDDNKHASEELFKHLCGLVDKTDREVESRQVQIARQVIIDGAAVFFPDKEARRKQLFTMMTSINGAPEAPSVSLTFQSLCQFFSSVDPSGLLDLPVTVSKDFDSDPVLAVMETLVTVAYGEFKKVLETVAVTDQSSHLVHLLCSLQTSLLAWCHRQITSDNKDSASTATNIIVKYAVLLSSKAVLAFELFQKNCEEWMTAVIGKLEDSFLATTVRQLVLIISMLGNDLTSMTRVKLLNNLMPLLKEICKVANQLPPFFYQVDSDHWQSLENGEVVLRTWEVESPHNYENNLHDSQIFSCPGATSFTVEFDPRCETEKRYDYLEFTDSRGVKTRFDQKVGTEKWPLQATFKGGHRLQFLFHSDSSNNEWGYKFKVTARGCPDMPLCWMFDLQLGMGRMSGCLCGATLDAQKVVAKPAILQDQEDVDIEMLKSELWTTLFKGGYMVGKLQRSLSGKYEGVTVAEDESRAGNFLSNMVENKEGVASKFLERCRDHCNNPTLGGEEVTKAITAVFAALLWHTQQLREETEKYAKYDGECKIPEGVHLAYSTAEGLRTFLIDQRQKHKLAAEKAGQDVGSADPVTQCRDKALFLLKFAGLTKVHVGTETKSCKMAKMQSNRMYSRMHSLQADKLYKIDSAAEKFPAFRLVLEFVSNQAWSKDRVQDLLQQRSIQAQATADVYMFAAEYIRINTNKHIFQVPNVLFLQELLNYQDQFPKHYADSLDGCGLDLETRVRRSFYTLLRRLVDSIRSVKRQELSKGSLACYDYILACMLHILDINWQPYDLAFVFELNLPDLYMELAKGSVSIREKTVSEQDETQELAEYHKHMKWLEECKRGFLEWYGRSDDAEKEEKKDMQMFVARFCDLLDVEISCDGCSVTLPGTRYRCLQCQDMDLCATCYAGGVRPGGDHADDHDIVHLTYKCDECQAFIVGTRIHCTVCEDFDLCYGCHNAGHFPAGHSSDHEIISYPMVKLKLSKQPDSSVQSYIHQHVWLEFVSLALSMAHLLSLANSSKSSAMMDTDYVATATQLHTQCVQLAIDCLLQVSKTADLEDVAEEKLSTKQAEAFAIHSQERIMGLLGAMIPVDNKGPLAADTSTHFCSQEFLKLLFTIARGEGGYEVNTQHLAMGLIGQLLQRATTCLKVVDVAVSTVKGEDVPAEVPEGQLTAQFLFSFGATCLERSGLEWANSVACILQKLFSAPLWRDVLLLHLSECISNLTQSVELSSIFALFVIAGFPEVISIGSAVKYNEIGVEVKTGVILKHFPDKNQTLVVDTKSRKRHTVKDEYVECVSRDLDVLDHQHITAFVNVIKDITTQVKSGQTVAVESMWVLSLTLKALLKIIQSETCDPIDDLFTADFVKSVVHLASQGTGFVQHWLLKDLEVLSLMLYTRNVVKQAEKKESVKEDQTAETKTEGEKEDTCEADGAVAASETVTDKESTPNPLQGLDDTEKLCFQTLHDNLKVPLSVLRAMYETCSKNTDALMVAVHENMDGDNFNPKPGILKYAKKWETPSKVETESTVDTGIHHIHLLLSPTRHKSRQAEEAAPEPAEDAQKLISQLENDFKNDLLKQRRSRSSSLLKKELETQGKSGSLEILVKINLAVSVLYSRQVLLSLLADWPATGPPITAQMIGCRDNAQIPFVLDLLNRPESKESFQKVVTNVIQHCSEDSLVPIASTACLFMEEASLTTTTKESEHNYKNNFTYEDKIQIKEALFLSIKFDSRCSTEEALDELVMSSSPDYSHDAHIFSGPRERWIDFDMPGDTLYYKFTSDCSNNDWGYKFTVTAGRLGRFDTGCTILNAVLSTQHINNLLPVNELWSCLVTVACKQTGQQRLRALQLLLKIMHSQHKVSEMDQLQLDLSILSPLWRLYHSMSEDAPDSSAIVPPVVRALTELFLVSENLAIEWDMVQQYVASLQDPQDIRRIVFQGLQNVAALSIMIGYQNKATEGFKALRAKLGHQGAVATTSTAK